jgi:hypothetical protein
MLPCYLLACRGVAGTLSRFYTASIAYATVAGVKTPSCADACKKYGFEALSGGKYKGGEPFYFCSVNFNGEGEWPGYNLYVPGKTGTLAGGCTFARIRRKGEDGRCGDLPVHHGQAQQPSSCTNRPRRSCEGVDKYSVLHGGTHFWSKLQ